MVEDISWGLETVVVYENASFGWLTLSIKPL